jgi:ATP-dependent DNA helicase RecQ
MRKYTANYAYTNPNFVIQNLVERSQNEDLLPILNVLKNILQRGFPTTMSKFLQEQIGELHKYENFEQRFLFVSAEAPVWVDTIKGDSNNNYYPAKDFFNNIIPKELGEYSFIQSLIIPEIKINDIVGDDNPKFTNQQVDFYLAQAKLVIEIDGQQHKKDDHARLSDHERNTYLDSKGIKTIRISTSELNNGTYRVKLNEITDHLKRHEKLLAFYRQSFIKISTDSIDEEEKECKLLPTAIVRFQILILELLTFNYLDLEHDWNFNIFNSEKIDDFADWAIKDLFVWLDQLSILKSKKTIKAPKYHINVISSKTEFVATTKAINIDFSLFKKYTDEHKHNPDIIYVRTDYFDIVKEKNYFRVSTSQPINYGITESDKDCLEFFLNNIFDKPHFREGQFPIIANALNRKDTIGLLPTGGGKSICYQLPCLLQPSINFVVCPIKSLMYDQNENLRNTLVTNVAWITSDLDANAKRQVELDFERGKYLFVWISPEKFQIPSFRDKIQSINANFSICYAVVDEVHCLSEWGHDFRTSYLNLAKTIDKLSSKDKDGNGNIKFIGLTATASVNVLKDIKIEFSRQKFKLNDENIKSLLDYSRKELEFSVINDSGNKRDKMKDLLSKLAANEGLTETKNKAAIVFTPNVNGEVGCYSISNYINTLYPEKSNWYSGEVPIVDEYTATGLKTGRKIPIMSPEEFKIHKDAVQSGFKKNFYPILVATKAFGMGIDKSNITYTFHYGIPSSVEALYQEAGRAGRWDKTKPENIDKKGKCFVLYSPETMNPTEVQKLFKIDTSFAEMKRISAAAGWNGKDLFKQIFLFVQGQNDIQEDYNMMLGVLNNYFKFSSTVKLYWSDVYTKLQINKDVLQKVIYRLSLLGIVTDWSTDFINHYQVDFATNDDSSILKHVAQYVNKYEPETNVKSKISAIKKDTIFEKASWYLLNWIFENIAHNRKQSLKTLFDWCNDFQDSDSFKRRIDNYFRFTETTFILQHISENPRDFEKWFEALTIVKRGAQNEKKWETFIPEIKDENDRNEKFGVLRDSISRFLESYSNNTGLNYLSGIVRLFLNEYNDVDGVSRFESALKTIKNDFSQQDELSILERTILIGTNGDEEVRFRLTESIIKFYPEKLEELAELYDMPYLMNDVYEKNVKKLTKLNNILYEQFGKI